MLSKIGDIPITSSLESTLSKIFNQLDTSNFFSIMIDKYINIIRNDYKTNSLFFKTLIISDSNSIYHLCSINDFLYQNNSSDDIRLYIFDIKISIYDKQE